MSCCYSQCPPAWSSVHLLEHVPCNTKIVPTTFLRIQCHHVSCSSKAYSFTMASDDGSASEHAPSPEFQVKSVMGVKVKGQKRLWLPETKQVEDLVFFSIGKWNRAATYALTGKGLDLRSHKAAHTMNGSFYDKLLKLRHEACVAELTKMFRQAAESIGETFDPKTMRDPTDNDKYIAGQIVEITLPEFQTDETKVGPLKACSVEIWTFHWWDISLVV